MLEPFFKLRPRRCTMAPHSFRGLPQLDDVKWKPVKEKKELFRSRDIFTKVISITDTYTSHITTSIASHRITSHASHPIPLLHSHSYTHPSFSPSLSPLPLSLSFTLSHLSTNSPTHFCLNKHTHSLHILTPTTASVTTFTIAPLLPTSVSSTLDSRSIGLIRNYMRQQPKETSSSK
ncbi:hypothetical protein BC939DRAFT_126179 [Gamsiella multidivaricata]|uniref:uncharacterized protein n=1 Tax=Gamsiella multidivaricata TaxID=101098 RepID=UPI002220D72D|nr:uncharacterized protein BC939DRAFT_126179 [Gamsiella multidivaricata]KAI7825259.1 hypothetical protein BC939DRAFT_126179 [Gamsiella multidivaricata]